MRRLCLLFAFVLAVKSAPTGAQDYPGWNGYPSFSQMNDIIKFHENIYTTSNQGLLKYDPSTEEYRYYFKDTDFNVRSLTTIAAGTKYLYIGSKQDGLYRFDPESEILEPILFPEYTTASLAINDIVALNDTVLFVAHSRGIDRLNLANDELQTFSRLSEMFDDKIPVTDIAVFGGRIWACTSQGLAWADVNDRNLESYTAWKSMIFGSMYSKQAAIAIAPFVNDTEDTNAFVATTIGGIVQIDTATFDTLYTSIPRVAVTGIVPGLGSYIAVSSANGIFIKSTEDDTWINDTTILTIMAIEPGSNNDFWLATGEMGIKRYGAGGYLPLKKVNMPSRHEIRGITIDTSGVIWATTANRDFNSAVNGAIQRFDRSEWQTLTTKADNSFNFNLTNALTVNRNGSLWGATWGKGLFMLDDHDTPDTEDDEAMLIDPEHDVILPLPGFETTGYVALPYLTTDIYGNIWIASFSGGVYVLEGGIPLTDYKHRHFTFEESGVDHFVMTVTPDPDGWVWVGTWETGLIALHTGTDPFRGTVNNATYITGGGGDGEILGTRVYSVAVDHDGDVWVGTNSGLNRIVKGNGSTLTVFDESDIFSSVTSNVFEVYAITIDDSGAKWIGTSAGLFLIGKDNKLEGYFTRENSGLLSNTIYSLRFDGSSDILWIGSNSGMNSFKISQQSVVTNNTFHFYPNPFEIWGTDTRAVFNGLKADEPLRIYTFDGVLVKELIPGDSDGKGGYQVEWDGTNDRGEIVGTGVFFFTGKDKNGLTFRQKMAVVRR
jgi:ligand-binding sensor domain-containing protein